MQHIKWLAALLIMVASASPSMAATSIETELFGPGTPNFDTVLNFNKFDPILGTLNSVKIVMQVDVQGGSLTVDNDGIGPASVTVELGAEGNVASVDVPLLNNLLQPVVSDVTASTSGLFNLGAENGDGIANVDGTGPDGAILAGGNDSEMQMGFINTLFHPNYTGAAATFNVTAEIDQILDFGGVGGVEGAFSPVTASGFVQVIYDYTAAVPEPASALMAAIGLCAVVLNRRQR